MTPADYLHGEAEMRCRQADAQAWLEMLLSGVTVHLRYGRYGEAERLARRALARASEPDHPGYADAVSALALAYQAQGRRSEAQELLRAHPGLSPQAPSGPLPLWRSDLPLDQRLRALAQPEPFPLDAQVAYPVPLDEIAGWARDLRAGPDPAQVGPLLESVKRWRRTELKVIWLGPLGQAAHAYYLDLDVHAPERKPRWLSLEIPGCGYANTAIPGSSLTVVHAGRTGTIPKLGRQRLFFSGSGSAPSVGTLALVRVGFDQGPPAQIAARA